MTAPFEWMAEATRLTRAGDLRGATVAVQAALRLPASAATSPLDIIDIEAAVVDERAPQARVRPAPAAAAFTDGSTVHRCGTRAYKLYVPPHAAGQRLPLVVMLHGCTQTAEDFARGTGMNELALRQGCAVLYPAQSHKANPQRCWNWFKHSHQERDRGEPAILAAMTRDVVQRHAIDDRRIYVAGLSAGGAMAAILGTTHPELYAAIGVHSGLPAGAAGDLPTALAAMKAGARGGAAAAQAGSPPVIVFHGDADATVHPANGEQAAAAAAGRAPVSVERARSPRGREYTRRVYRDGGSGRVLAEHWSVHGAGHAWSGGAPGGSYTDATGPDASAEMLRFFLEHPQP